MQPLSSLQTWLQSKIFRIPSLGLASDGLAGMTGSV